MDVDFLSKPIQIGNKTAANRFVVLPNESNDGLDSGAPSERSIGRYKKYVEGQAGIVFSESVLADIGGRARIHQLYLGDETVDGYARLIDELRKVNPKVIYIIQVDHCGSLADPEFSDPIAIYRRESDPARLLTDDEIQQFRDKFIHTALLAHRAGADGVEIKFAHGFFGNEFLQPANTREGRYGGSFENRTRFFSEIVEGIKQQVDHNEFLLGVRFSAYEGVSGGFGTAGPREITEDLSEPVAFAKLAQEAGVKLISSSAGHAVDNLEILLPTDDSADAVYKHFGWTRTIKQAVDIPVIGAGYSYLRDGRNKLPGEDPAKKSFIYWAEKNLKENNVDLVGLARQAIADPLLPKKLLSGDQKSVNWCTLCMDCGMLLGEQQEVGCSVYDRYYRKLAKKIKAEAVD
jgi:2,4-dienoyl-CoA reductase-like NADH-dependent reductase (Old Yellow Enzyme family)